MNLNETLKVLMQKSIIDGITYTDRVSWSFTNEENKLTLIEHIHFKNCIFEEDFRIANLHDENLPVKFENCVFKKAFLINISKLFSLEIDECIINGDATILESQIDEIDIRESILSSYLLLSGLSSDSCSILGNEKTKIKQIFLASKEVNTFILDAKKGVNNLCIRAAKRVEIGSELDQLEIDTNEFNHITYLNEDNERLKLGELIIHNLYFSGNILFERIDIENLNMLNVTCTDGAVRFNELNVMSSDFENVNIESFFWNQITFEKELSIERCNFNSLTYSNIIWLKQKRVSDSFLDESIPLFYGIRKNYLADNSCYNSADLVQLRYERETYKQLKAAAVANHNNIEALDFYRNEMRLYWKEVRIAGGISLQNRMLVFLNRWSSDFGQNWLLPITWLFAFHLFWFSCLIRWNFYNNPWTGWQEFAEYAKLINPTHDIPKYVNTGSGYLTDIIMRVSIGYFVYHIIKATRKYGKI